MDGRIGILVVDDHPVARFGIDAMLAAYPDLLILAALPDGHALDAYLEESDRARASILLLDLYLGVEEPCLDVISRVAPRIPVLVLSAAARPPDVLSALCAGASGYLTKCAEPDLLAGAVRTVASGGFALSAHLADILCSATQQCSGRVDPTAPARGSRPGMCGPARDPLLLAPLSVREEQALELIANGFTHAQAATRMGVSLSTVNTYIERIRRKLGVGNKAELARASIARGAAASDASAGAEATGHAFD